MRLSARVIKNYANINNFDFANQWMIRAGDPNVLYFQLVDLDQSDSKGLNPLRYVAGAGMLNQPASIVVTFPSIDDANELVINAVAVDALDGSLWKVTLAPDQIPGSGSVQFALTENTTIRRFNVLGMMSVEYPDSDGSC